MPGTDILVRINHPYELVEELENWTGRVGDRHATGLGEHADFASEGLDSFHELDAAAGTPVFEVAPREREQCRDDNYKVRGISAQYSGARRPAVRRVEHLGE